MLRVIVEFCSPLSLLYISCDFLFQLLLPKPHIVVIMGSPTDTEVRAACTQFGVTLRELCVCSALKQQTKRTCST